MAALGRNYNDVVTRFWSLAAPVYDLPFLQQWVYRPAQEEVLAQLRSHGARRIADIACGTGILAARIAAELHPEQVYGVDMSDGMLRQAGARSTDVQWLKAPAEQLPFDDAALDAVWWRSRPLARPRHRCCAGCPPTRRTRRTVPHRRRCGRCSPTLDSPCAISTASTGRCGPSRCGT